MPIPEYDEGQVLRLKLRKTGILDSNQSSGVYRSKVEERKKTIMVDAATFSQRIKVVDDKLEKLPSKNCLTDADEPDEVSEDSE